MEEHAARERAMQDRAGSCQDPGIDRVRVVATVAVSLAQQVVTAHTRRIAGARGVCTWQLALAEKKGTANREPSEDAAGGMAKRAASRVAACLRQLARAVRVAWNNTLHHCPMVTTSWETWQTLCTRQAYCLCAKERARLNASFFAW